MPKIKLTFDISELAEIARRLPGIKTDRATSQKIIDQTIPKMKQFIKGGQSPIRGVRRFDSYRGSYLENIREGKYQKYGKSEHPINLTLSGAFLNDLKGKVVPTPGGSVAEIGFFSNTSLSVEKEAGHREGTRGQAKRPIIPTIFERFAQTIENIHSRIYSEFLDKELRKLDK